MTTPADRATAETVGQRIGITRALRRVLNACETVGGRPILVGGCVRDALQSGSAPSKDIDIEVYGVSGKSLWDSLSSLSGVHIDEDGTPMGVFKVRLEGEDFDVTLPRKDSLTGEGRTGFSVEINPDLTYAEAFARRDYTINSMGYDPSDDSLIDPYGGHDDLSAGVLRHTSEAFSEDPIRVLRGVQFVARFGYSVAPETLEIMRELSPAFHGIHPNNIWKQFYALTARGRYISKAMEVLQDIGWAEHFPTYFNTIDVPQGSDWHPEGNVAVHLGLSADAAVRIADREELEGKDRVALVLAALTHDFGKAVTTSTVDGKLTSFGHAEAGVPLVQEFLSQIGAPQEYAKRILPMVSRHMCHSPQGNGEEPSTAAVRRLIRSLNTGGGGPTLKEWTLLVEADKEGRGAGARSGGPSNLPAWLRIAEELGGERTVSKTILSGKVLKELGLKPGPVFKFIIEQSIEAQNEGLFTEEDGAAQWFTENQGEVLSVAYARCSEQEERERVHKDAIRARAVALRS